MSAEQGSVDRAAVERAVARQQGQATPGTGDIGQYHARQVHDKSHREVIGPLLPVSGTSAVITHQGRTIATWGNPDLPEMSYSVTKSIVSLVAGIAHERGLLPDVEDPVATYVQLPQFADGTARSITWKHLLQQTSQWNGQLWGKPASADAAAKRLDTVPGTEEPGSGWAYNDVRVNLLCLALTALFRQSLADVFHEAVLEPMGASESWSWHGYANSVLEDNGRQLTVVSGGAHWGGGLWISARDLVLIGQLYLRRGRWGDSRLVEADWIDRTWEPCVRNPDYGYLWWLNNRRRIFPSAPETGRCAQGNRGQHLLWVDPARDLVVATHWSSHIDQFLHELSAAIPPSRH